MKFSPSLARFYIHIWNNYPKTQGVEHLASYLKHGLGSTDHLTGYTLTIPKDAQGYHVFVENFGDDVTAFLRQYIPKVGRPIIIVCTEFPSEASFFMYDDEVSEERRGPWRRRFENFLRVAELADSLWLVTENQRPGYERLFAGKNIQVIPFRYDDIEANVDGGILTPKLFQSFFLGRETPYRNAILADLKKRISIDHPVDLPYFLVPDGIKTALSTVSLSYQPDWKYPSIVRLHMMLTHGAYNFLEKTEMSCELTRFCEVIDRKDFVEAVVQRVTDPNLPVLARQARGRYQALGTMKEAFVELLGRSFPAEFGHGS